MARCLYNASGSLRHPDRKDEPISDQAKSRQIYVSTFDHRRLKELLHVVKQFDKSPASFLGDLERELDGAHVVDPSEIPPYLVTMNTRVKLVDTDSGKEHVFTLVFPVDEDEEEGKLSILSDMGTAVFGFSVGDTVEWKFPDGVRHFRIDMIFFQPEATKQYDL